MTPAEYAEFGGEFFKWFWIVVGASSTVVGIGSWLGRDQY